MHKLRSPGGCPWDCEQTHSSLIKYLIEETYEVAEAVESGNDRELVTELGDVLLQVVFHAEMAEGEGRFTIVDVLEAICKKMVHRHPHVFGEAKADDAEAVLRQWEDIKSKEKQGDYTVLQGVPDSLPALLKAQRYQSRASQVGFDWENAEQVMEKVREEVDEFEAAVEGEDAEKVHEEFGDLLFALVNWARMNGVDAEKALQDCNRKFTRRFSHIESSLIARGSSVQNATIEEMDVLWEEAKKVVERR
jgi:tetrapyrrole methylase family protein/MazG family protein